MKFRKRKLRLSEPLSAQIILISSVAMLFLIAGCQTSSSVSPLTQTISAQGPFRPAIAPGSEDAHYKLFYLESISHLNEATKDTPYVELPLPELIKLTKGQAGEEEVFRSACDAWNHEFFWKSVKSGGGSRPSRQLLEAMEVSFGSYENFKAEFLNAAEYLEGNGWLWIVLENDAIKIMTRSNYETPLAESVTPLLALDLWEHAYISKYQNNRRHYAEDFLSNLANWEFAENNLQSVTPAKAGV